MPKNAIFVSEPVESSLKAEDRVARLLEGTPLRALQPVPKWSVTLFSISTEPARANKVFQFLLAAALAAMIDVVNARPTSSSSTTSKPTHAPPSSSASPSATPDTPNHPLQELFTNPVFLCLLSAGLLFVVGMAIIVYCHEKFQKCCIREEERVSLIN